MKITRRKLSKLIENKILEGQEEKLAKLGAQMQQKNVLDIMDRTETKRKSKDFKKTNYDLSTGVIGTIELYDPNKEIYKIKIDNSNYESKSEPQHIKAARLQYDALENSLRLKGRKPSEYDSEFFAQVINPGQPDESIKILPSLKQGVPTISIKRSF